MSLLVAFSCPNHGWLVDASSAAVVTCACGVEAKSDLPYLHRKANRSEPRRQTYGGDPSSYDFPAALAACESKRPEPFADRVARCDFTREVTYGYGYATKPDLRLVVAKDTPTKDELSKHASRFGQAGVRELVAALPAEDNGLSRKSELAELKEKARKRSKWRRNLEQEARLLLERKPDLLPMAVADVLNISDRRAKSLLTKIVVGSQA